MWDRKDGERDAEAGHALHCGDARVIDVKNDGLLAAAAPPAPPHGGGGRG